MRDVTRCLQILFVVISVTTARASDNKKSNPTVVASITSSVVCGTFGVDPIREARKVSVRKVKEKTRLVQLGAVAFTHNDSVVYVVDKAQNAVLKLNMSNATIEEYYSPEDKLELWFRKDSAQIYQWPDGVLDSTDYWREFQERSALTEIKSIHQDSAGLHMLCRLHTGIKREYTTVVKRILWQVAIGIVQLTQKAEPSDVHIISSNRYSVRPPAVTLSNGSMLSMVNWKGYYDSQQHTPQALQDSGAVIGSYDKAADKLTVSMKSSAYFDEVVTDDDVSFYPDEKAGFFGVSNKYHWFFHASPSGVGEYEYKQIEPQGVWQNESQSINSMDCFYADGKLNVIISLSDGELWAQEYGADTGAFEEEKLMSRNRDPITQMKVVRFSDRAFAVLVKYHDTRWSLLETNR